MDTDPHMPPRPPRVVSDPAAAAIVDDPSLAAFCSQFGYDLSIVRDPRVHHPPPHAPGLEADPGSRERGELILSRLRHLAIADGAAGHVYSETWFNSPAPMKMDVELARSYGLLGPPHIDHCDDEDSCHGRDVAPARSRNPDDDCSDDDEVTSKLTMTWPRQRCMLGGAALPETTTTTPPPSAMDVDAAPPAV